MEVGIQRADGFVYFGNMSSIFNIFLKFIGQQPLIRKHSYLDHRYPGGLAFIPCHRPSCSGMELGVQRAN